MSDSLRAQWASLRREVLFNVFVGVVLALVSLGAWQLHWSRSISIGSWGVVVQALCLFTALSLLFRSYVRAYPDPVAWFRLFAVGLRSVSLMTLVELIVLLPALHWVFPHWRELCFQENIHYWQKEGHDKLMSVTEYRQSFNQQYLIVFGVGVVVGNVLLGILLSLIQSIFWYRRQRRVYQTMDKRR